MAIKMSVKDAKSLGYSIKGYVFIKNKKTPVAIIERSKKRKKYNKQTKKNNLIDEGRIVRIDLKKLM